MATPFIIRNSFIQVGWKRFLTPCCLFVEKFSFASYNSLSHRNSDSALISKQTSFHKLNLALHDSTESREGNSGSVPNHTEGSPTIQSIVEEAKESSVTAQLEEMDFVGLSEIEKSALTSDDKPMLPKVNPQDTSVLLFPGQGSQFVGMCNDFLKYPNVSDMFEVASDLLRYDLKGLCVNGPKGDLDQTMYCQPAVFVTSLAAVEKLKAENPQAIENCVTAAGFSVGEFAALVFAGSLAFEEALYLIQVRAEAMQRASENVKTGMLSVVGRNKARYNYMCKEAATYCQNNGVKDALCRVANYLYPDARVLAGNVEALDFIQERAKEFHLRLARRLPVSGAFHTPFMESAQERFNKALDKVTFQAPLINVHSNVDGRVYQNPKQIKEKLKKQLTMPVKWEQTMHEIFERKKGVAFPKTYEVGPGKQLGTILQRINLKAYEQYTKVS